MSDLISSIKVLESGMNAQSARISVISQNIANKDSTSTISGGEPYRRKTIYFKNRKDRTHNVEMVEVAKYGHDNSDFKIKLEPSHPAADERGYVLYPNIDDIIENTDAQEAQLSYRGMLNALSLTKGMIARTLDVLNK